MRTLTLAVALGLLLLPYTAKADEPRSATEPRVMEEPGEVTNVIDAFEDGDPFDLNVSLGFDYASKSARIMRETTIAEPGLSTGGFTTHLMNVADYSETTSRLVPRVDIGIYHDLAAYVKLPIILSNSRKLDGTNGTDAGDVQRTVLQGAPGEQLFRLPFKAPDRSGIENLTVGLEFDIFNQARDHTKPTWLVGFEGRFSIGTPMHACNPDAANGQVDCADPSDVNRNGQSDGTVDATGKKIEGDNVDKLSPGITRGTVGLELHTLLSRRVKYVEPYGGFTALFEFNNSDVYDSTNFEGSLVNHPPLVGTMIIGMMIIPWEHREKYSRLTLDFRFAGQYHSEGRDYSELFDALGSSDAKSLRTPQYSKYTGNPTFNAGPCQDNNPATPCQPQSVVDQGSQQTYFSGLSDVQAYGSYRASASITWQASEYVKFTLGGGFRHDQSHGITNDQPCNPDFKGDIRKSGPCHSGDEQTGNISPTGIPNPNYRAPVNAVGRRFFVDDSNTFDVFASGVVMF